MTKDLIKLSKECPDMIVSVKLGELVEFGNILISNVKNELEQTIADQRAENYLSRVGIISKLIGRLTRNALSIHFYRRR